MLFTVPLGLASSACILLVSLQDPGGAHCRFAGSETPCGACLAKQCTAAVDGCCLGEQCGGVVTDVEACAGGAAEACGRVADPQDRGGAHGDLARCIAASCADACAVPAKLYSTHCQRAYVTSVETCRCDVSSAANDTPCTETGHPDLRCCAPEGWPGASLECDCLRILCIAAGAGCLCQLGSVDENMRATTCTGAVCCLDPTEPSCTCDPSDTSKCMPGETQVPTCNIDVLACGNGKHHVESCTLPK